MFAHIVCTSLSEKRKLSTLVDVKKLFHIFLLFLSMNNTKRKEVLRQKILIFIQILIYTHRVIICLHKHAPNDVESKWVNVTSESKVINSNYQVIIMETLWSDCHECDFSITGEKKSWWRESIKEWSRTNGWIETPVMNGGNGICDGVMRTIVMLMATQWQPQDLTTIFLYFLRITFELSSKYKTIIAESFVGAQQGLGTKKGFMRWTKVWTMAWFVAFMWGERGKEHSPWQKNAAYPSGAIIQSWVRQESFNIWSKQKKDISHRKSRRNERSVRILFRITERWFWGWQSSQPSLSSCCWW